MAQHIVTDLTRALREEHHVELRILEGFEGGLKALEEGKEVLEGTLFSLRETAETAKAELEFHFRKEEVALFPILKPHLGMGGNPIGALETEHREILKGIQGFQQALRSLQEEKGEGFPEALQAVKEHGHHLLSLLRRHTQKEDNIFFDLAEISLTEAEKKLVDERMARFGSL